MKNYNLHAAEDIIHHINIFQVKTVQSYLVLSFPQTKNQNQITRADLWVGSWRGV